MTLFTVSMTSKALCKRTELSVLAPAGGGKPRRVLWALHGMTDDHTGWLRSTRIEGLAERYGLVVVMPNADLSFYTDMAFGADYFTFLTEELPAFAAEHFGASSRREDNALIGNSMGGYGAFLAALRCPDCYGAAVSLSGPMRIEWIHRTLSDAALAEAFSSGDLAARNRAADRFSASTGVPLALVHSLMRSGGPTVARTFRAMYGTDYHLDGGEWDLVSLAEKLDGDGPRLLAWCGEQDYHYSSNLWFQERFQGKALDYRLVTGAGSHDWDYWNPAIESALAALYGE